jgi:phospholipid/cholesterol/gamma-HCH transport system substrate-binding protein
MSLFTSTERERRLALRAGLFVGVGLLVAGIVVFVIGRDKRLFEKQVSYRAFFTNVDGLSDQSPVWLGGKDVGRVTAIRFSPDLNDNRLEVTVTMSAAHAERVRGDSVVRLTSLGVLGDKAIDISLGTPKAPPLEPGGVLPVGASADLSTLMKGAGTVMENSVAISESLRRAVEAYGDRQVTEDVKRSLASVRGMLEAVEKGDGVLHALIYDKQAGDQVRVLLANTARAAARVDTAGAQVEALLGQVRKGEGFAHALFYEPGGAKALEELGAAAGQLAGLLEDAKKNPDGAVHQLIYGDSGNMLADLGGAAADLRTITSTIARGEGTVGGLIADPTIYEDLRTILGNVKRNRVLRSLVRFTVQNRTDLDQVGRPQEQQVRKAQPEATEALGGSGKPEETEAQPPEAKPLPVLPPLPPLPPPEAPAKRPESKLDRVPPP